MNDCGNCKHRNHLGLPDFSTMPCAVCARHEEDNDPTMWEARPKTNYYRLVSKTPQELAEYLSDIAGWLSEYEGKAHALLKWLKAPVEEADNGA